GRPEPRARTSRSILPEVAKEVVGPLPTGWWPLGLVHPIGKVAFGARRGCRHRRGVLSILCGSAGSRNPSSCVLCAIRAPDARMLDDRRQITKAILGPRRRA